MTNKSIIAVASIIALLIVAYLLFICPLSNTHSDITFTVSIEDEEFTAYEVTKIEKSTIISVDILDKPTLNYQLIVEVHKGYTMVGDLLYWGRRDIPLWGADIEDYQYTAKHVKNTDIATYKIALWSNGIENDYVEARLWHPTLES